MHDYRHLLMMTDQNGILQFSRLNKPDPLSGYTLDDNARALIIALSLDEGYELASVYLSYLKRAQNIYNGWCNLIYSNGSYSSAFDSEDSVGRAILACSLATCSPWEDLSRSAFNLLENSLSRVLEFSSPRGMAYALIGLCKCNINHRPANYWFYISHLSQNLISLYQSKHSPEWLWFEDNITYCNGILPQAMFAVYTLNGDKRALKIGHDSINFLSNILFRKGYLNIVGNQGWYKRGGTIPVYDQQPVDASSIISALVEAYESVGVSEYLDLAVLAHGWYRGVNIHGISLYDEKSGGCYDGLTQQGLNLNQGAEAVISLLLSDLLVANATQQRLLSDNVLESSPVV